MVNKRHDNKYSRCPFEKCLERCNVGFGAESYNIGTLHVFILIKIPILRLIYFDLHFMMLIALMTLHTFKRIRDK